MTGVYLDYNASAPVLPAAAEAVAMALRQPGNPSSVHAFGRAARARMEDAREAVARLVGATPAQVVFTSGGTEAAALALHAFRDRPALVSAIEHPCVLEALPGAERMPVTADGVLHLDWLADRLRRAPAPAVVALMLANNETGVLQPVAEAAALARAAGAAVFCDAVQGPGKVVVDITALGVDLLALSAHKLGGPQGVGAVVARAPEALAPLVAGGGQERGRRGGTQNGPGIAGFGAAARAIAAGECVSCLNDLRDRLEDGIRRLAPQAAIWGAAARRLPNTTCVGLPGVDQQRALMALDLAGVAVSAGSACSSGKVAPSHVLTAMGATPRQAREAIRVSLGWRSTARDVDAFLDAWGALARSSAA
ncbi:cysteine desulfurase family protein [Novispirillum sp. DQ9]|uniref:cysteine desulfurase family protein n=1 Tax=Novispirillum sp. DQ9 TaxID=3398612 RepID=UPI003C7CECFD